MGLCLNMHRYLGPLKNSIFSIICFKYSKIIIATRLFVMPIVLTIITCRLHDLAATFAPMPVVPRWKESWLHWSLASTNTVKKNAPKNSKITYSNLAFLTSSNPFKYVQTLL